MSVRAYKALVIGGTTTGGLGQQVARELRMRDHFDYVANGVIDVRVDIPNRSDLDVREFDKIDAYVGENGPYDYIVYCAGNNHLTWIHDLMLEDFIEDFSVNAFGFAGVLAAHETHWPEAVGSAVAIASDAARNPMRGSTIYCASKAALVQIAKTAARELAPRWRVNTVSPSIIAGTLMTQYIDATVPGFRGWDPEKMVEYEKTQLPLGRRATVQEVSSVVLATLFGPTYQTGSDVQVSGGK